MADVIEFVERYYVQPVASGDAAPAAYVTVSFGWRRVTGGFNRTPVYRIVRRGSIF